MTEHHVEEYLGRLRVAAKVLPPAARTELIAETRGRIEGALSIAGDPAVVAIVAGLGAPNDLVAARRDQLATAAAPVTQQKSMASGALAVALLVLGGVVVPFVGWFVGVALLWRSPRWTVREKVVGTVIFPGGMLLPLMGQRLTPHGSQGISDAVIGVGLLCATVIQVAIGGWLLLRLRRGLTPLN
jgi:hypothetical protein